AADRSRVTLHVQGEHDEPAAQVPIALGRELDGTDLLTFTDEHGDAAFESVEGGWWEARAGGGAGGLARERLFVDAPAALHWNARFDRGAHVSGHVFDATGKPAANTIVRWESVPAVVERATTVRMSMETKGGEELAERGEPGPTARGELRRPWVDQVS